MDSVEQEKQITYSDFERVDMRIGKIVRAEEFPKARKPAYKLWIDFGILGVKKSSAQITHQYALEDLIGKLVLAVTNFPVKQIGDVQSEVLVLGVTNESGHVVLVGPDSDVALGSRLF